MENSTFKIYIHGKKIKATLDINVNDSINVGKTLCAEISNVARL
jgi:hypothetical protein